MFLYSKKLKTSSLLTAGMKKKCLNTYMMAMGLFQVSSESPFVICLWENWNGTFPNFPPILPVCLGNKMANKEKRVSTLLRPLCYITSTLLHNRVDISEWTASNISIKHLTLRNWLKHLKSNRSIQAKGHWIAEKTEMLPVTDISGKHFKDLFYID